MIRRYSREAMQRIWSDENRYQKWLDVEIAACEGWASLGRIPEKSLENIRKKARFTVERIEEIEAVTRHDVIAFVSCVAEYVGEDARFIHMGMTSSDVLDTALALQLKESGELILTGIRDLMDVLKRRAFEFKHTPAMGRSHGIHAEPISFGLKFALWYAEMARNLKRMEDAVETVSYGKISGAVGTFANIPPEVEEYACRMLGLKPAPISTQIIQRDRHAEYLAALADQGYLVEALARALYPDGRWVGYRDDVESAAWDTMAALAPDACTLFEATFISGASGRTGSVQALRSATTLFLIFSPRV